MRIGHAGIIRMAGCRSLESAPRGAKGPAGGAGSGDGLRPPWKATYRCPRGGGSERLSETS